MDARAFVNYLKDELLKMSQPFQNNLLQANYPDMYEHKKAAGVNMVLIQIVNGLDSTLEAFYKKGGHSTIQDITSVINEVV